VQDNTSSSLLEICCCLQPV